MLLGKVTQPTVASTWQDAAGRGMTGDLLEWPPDVFAFANVVLSRSEAFRFALSPLGEWPPSRHPNWRTAVVDAGRRWGAWVDDRSAGIPELLAAEWAVLQDGTDVPLEELAAGRERHLCEALLTVHAIADEACAGLGIALDTSDSQGCIYRARGRELLARTGSMARLDAQCLRVLPKVSTPPTGRPSFSRYACVNGPGIDAGWHKVPARHRGTDPRSEYATLLLLPWPLRVRASDFRPLDGSVERLAKDPFGFFEFAPPQGLDFDLLERVLAAAREEVGGVDVVVLPESAVDESEIDALESQLQRHGVVSLLAGIRQPSPEPGRLPGNWMHIGMNPGLEKGSTGPSTDGAAWLHVRQNKHHRWSLDQAQIYQYHLGGPLHPDIRWWEAIEVPRRALQFVEVAELTLVALVCEDLAQNDNVAELIRSVGPTLVMAGLLDGPQLTSRWAARYASVLTDDPGSSVLTLTSFGMAQRSRPNDRDASRVIALWKDPDRGVREIQLDPGAHGVVLTLCASRATRRSADGRWPVDNGTSCFDVAVHQIQAATLGSSPPASATATFTVPALGGEELTILTAWAEAVAEAAAHAPERFDDLFTEARAGAQWRSDLGVSEPSTELAEAIDALERVARATAAPFGAPLFDAMLTEVGEPRVDGGLDELVRRVLLSMLEQRRTRQPLSANYQVTHGRTHQ